MIFKLKNSIKLYQPLKILKKNIHEPSLLKQYPNHIKLNSKSELLQIKTPPSLSPNQFNPNDFVLIPDFITEEEEALLQKITDKKLKREYHYLENHLDNRIQFYKECQISDLSSLDNKVQIIINKVKGLFDNDKSWLPIHILDLSLKGSIQPHVDNIELSGPTIGCISLLSDCIITFQSIQNKDFSFNVHVPRRSFYVQKDTIRYQFEHSLKVLANERNLDSKLMRRISWLFRDPVIKSN